ncbi:MAG TPA: ClpXP protease specificity-enhancing factor SspB [Alphaproteobacteria bacterium]
MSGDPLNYQAMTEDALRSVLRQALIVAAQRGLPGQHHFYLTFRSTFPGVDIADHLRERHPEEMTIVLQHQFWGLDVTDKQFAVTLSFNGQHERLTVPFAAVTAFVDPSVQFGLQFSVSAPEDSTGPVALPPKASPPAVPAPAAAVGAPTDPAAPPDGEPGPEGGARVVALDAFRKTDGRKK